MKLTSLLGTGMLALCFNAQAQFAQPEQVRELLLPETSAYEATNVTIEHLDKSEITTTLPHPHFTTM
jgi:hypothetical protein